MGKGTFFLHAEECFCIVRRGCCAAMTDHRFVTCQLDVPIGEKKHQPHERIEPVNAYGGGQQNFPQGVEAADVGAFIDVTIGKVRGFDFEEA